VFPIPVKKLGVGAELCRDYAVKLAECALENLGKYPTIAFSLIIVALEEVGKGIFLLENFEKGNELTEAEWKRISYGAKAHRKKLKIVHTALIDPYSVLKPHELSVKLKEYKEFQHIEGRVTKQIYDLKLNSLYVDWKGDKNQWGSPIQNKSYDVTEAFKILQSAILLLSEKIREVQKHNS
jgi:AbiV family abortive infection protein